MERLSVVFVIWLKILTFNDLYTRNFFKTANDYPVQDRPGYNLNFLDLRNQQEIATPQSLEVNFDFPSTVAARYHISAYALLLTKKGLSNISDGQSQFDIL